MKRIFFLLTILSALCADAQIVNRFRDSTNFYGSVRMDSIVRITKGAAAGRVLTSDANGTATWQPAAGSGASLWDSTGSNLFPILTSYNAVVGDSSAKAKLHVRGALSDVSFLAGDSATNAGGKTFILNKSFFGLTLPSIRSGYVGDLSGIGLGNGTTFWNPDSIGVGSLVLNSINSKATAINAQIIGGAGNAATGPYSNIIGGAGNAATGPYSNIIGGLLNTASGQSSIILNSTAATASDTSATIISSGTSTASADVATIIGSNTCTVSGAVSSIISGASSTVSGRSSGILHSSGSTVSANNSLILNSSDSHIDFDTNGNANLIAASTLAGIDGNARLAVALGSYKSFQYGTHSISLGSAYDTTYAYHEIVIGNSAFHDPSGTSNSMVKGDMFIGIGNATDSTEHQNCFIMIKNGNTVIGDSLNIGDKPAPTDAMLRIKGDVKIDSLLSLASGLDSVTIYALTPANGTMTYCNNCTGSGVTGRVVVFINSAWRRLTFN